MTDTKGVVTVVTHISHWQQLLIFIFKLIQFMHPNINILSNYMTSKRKSQIIMGFSNEKCQFLAVAGLIPQHFIRNLCCMFLPARIGGRAAVSDRSHWEQTTSGGEVPGRWRRSQCSWQCKSCSVFLKLGIKLRKCPMLNQDSTKLSLQSAQISHFKMSSSRGQLCTKHPSKGTWMWLKDF